jgi:DNA-directed RNA polymerase subunit alpha
MTNRNMFSPNFKVKEEILSDTKGEFVIEPLEPGYGHTLGNALRRTLLTSIPGAAVTSVKINSVKHKFSTIPGVKENVVDILLNIKNLNFKLLDGKKATVSLSAKGPKKITGEDFDVSENLEITNKDCYVASVNDKKSKLELELTVEEGLGYASSDEKKSGALGVISTDATFTPVKRVSYDVSATRVGRQTDLDKLVLKIWTNGAISPKDALMNAAKILSSYFLQVYEPKSVVSSEGGISKVSVGEDVSKMTVDELDLPTRIYNSLRNGSIETVGDLLAVPRKELVSMRNMGNKSISVIEEKLKEKGVSLMI